MKKISLRRRLMITFLCIFFVPVIVLGIPGILIIGQRSRAAAEARLAGQFEQTYSNVQRMFSEMDSFAREMEKTQMVYALTYMQDTSQIHTRYSAIDYHAFAYQLMISMINNDSFDDLAILFPQINFGLTQRGEYQMDQILMNEFHVGDLDANAWKEVLQDSVGSHVLLLNRQMQTFEVVRSGTVYLYCPRPSFGNDPRLAFLFFLSEGGLRSRFQKIGLNQMVNVYISKDNATQTLLAAASEAEGKVYTLSGALNDIGATLTLTIPESVLYEDWHTLRQALFLFLLLIMLVGSLVTVLAATINYKPLEHLFSVLFSSGTIDAPNPTSDDLQSIGQLLSNLSSQSREINENIVLHRDMLRYAALARLMDGTLDKDSMISTFRALDMEFSGGWFTIGILMSNSTDVIRALVDLCYEAKITCYSITMERYQAFLLNHKEPLDVLKLDYAGEIYFAASDPYSDLSESTRAYHQAKSILDYRPVSNPTFFLTSKNLLQRDTFYFPLEEERKLNNLIRAGDLEGAMEKCDSLIETNLQSAPSVVGINQFFDMLELNISRLMGKEQRVALPGSAIASVDARRERLRALLGSLKQAEVPVREASEEFSVIVDYIDENLVDPQLSLYSVANHFSMNPSALSKMIKRELGIGYLDFVNQKRIELAKAHLRSGRISIRDLAQTVGFDNDATLRRLFKKYEGITPTQYHE